MAADGFDWRADRAAGDDAETALLAALLVNPAAFEALPEGFGAHYFTTDSNREIYEAAFTAAEGGATRLLPFVSAMLPHLDGAGGRLEQLRKAGASARVEDAVFYASVIKELDERRQILALAEEMKRSVEVASADRQPNTVILNRAIASLEQIAAAQRVSQPSVMIGPAAFSALQAGQKAAESGNALSGLSTYFPSLDRRLGGMEPGAVYLIGGRPGSGKSGLGLQIGLRAALDGKRVAIFSLEMKAMQLGRRALSLASGVSLADIKTGNFARDPDMANALIQAQQQLDDLPLLIEDESSLMVQAIQLRAKQASRKLGGLDLLIIDHLHIVGRPEGSARHGDTFAITEVSHGIKRIAKALDVPVLELAQLSRSVENRDDKRPGLPDLRQSGTIEEDVDVAMFLYRQDYYTANLSEAVRERETPEVHQRRIEQQRRYAEENRGKAEVIFDKVRDGEDGTEHLRFDAPRVRFHEEGDAEGRS